MTKKVKSDHALIIFIRNPELGKVKSRLAQSVGPERALLIYQQLLDHTRGIALGVDTDRHLYYSHFIDKTDQWSSDDFTKAVQIDGDLGQKMHAALTETLATANSAILIGSDCAQLTSEILSQAHTALMTHDVVVGPSMDGGYYLIGMNQAELSLFDRMTWSTDQVLQETLRRAQEAQLSVFQLPMLSDIDYIEDWEQYGLR